MQKKNKRRQLLILLGIFIFIPIFTAICWPHERKTIEASTTVSSGDFKLTVTNNWSEDDKKNYAYADWEEVSDLSNKGYMLYQSEGGTFSKVSTNYNKSIKVLNVYPNIAASNTLKTWMDKLGTEEGLQDGNKEPMIQVTPIDFDTYNANSAKYLKDSQGNYQYDVVMFGSYDVYGGANNDLSAQSTSELIKYIEAGYGVLLGHDTAYSGHQNFRSIGNSYLGISTTITSPSVGSTKVQIVDNGYLMKYPFEMEENLTMTIPLCHSTQIIDTTKSRIWLKFLDPIEYGGPFWSQGTNTNNFYVATSKTHENLAMIQTGHSNGASTLDEQKILANVLYNLAQLTKDAYADDHTVKDDQAPDAPTTSIRCGEDGKMSIKIDTLDHGKEYQWYVEATKKNNALLKSDVVSEEIISNVAGYFYEVSDSPSSNLQSIVEGKKDEYGRIPETEFDVYVAPSSNRIDYQTATSFSINETRQAGRYLHVLAVDRASNVSSVTTTELDDILQYVDFDVERTADVAKLININLDPSLDKTQKSIEIQTPLNFSIENFDSLSLPSGWDSFKNSTTTEYKSFVFAIESQNDLKTIQSFIETLRFSIEEPVNQAASIRVLFHQKVYTTRVDSEGVTHYYTFVREINNWLEAYNLAKTMTYKGLTGYLATLTSEEEHDFVYDNIAKDFGWLGGTRMLTANNQKINDADKVSESISDYITDVNNAPEWYWADGPESGLVFFDKATYASGGKSPNGVYNGFNNEMNNKESEVPGKEPNNSGVDIETVLQFAQMETVKYWNDVAYNVPIDIAGYYVEFSEYNGQKETEEITDVCWRAAVPQKISLKAFDEEGNALPEADLQFDQKLVIGQQETVDPIDLSLYDFSKLLDKNSTIHGLSYEITDTFQEGQLIYAYRGVAVHVRQVVTPEHSSLVIPNTGFGYFESTNSSKEIDERFPTEIPSSDLTTLAFKEYLIRYQEKFPIYTFTPVIPEYYDLAGFVVTYKDGANHTKEDSQLESIQIDVSKENELWLTVYLEPSITSDQSPKFYHWDYLKNDFGSLKVE